MNRLEFWYFFGLFAVALILLRLRPTRRIDLRDPVAISFTLGLFLGAFGTLSKQPALANLIDGTLGPNAAWLVADGLFLVGLCAGTYWVDLMRTPTLRHRGWRLLGRWRVAALIATVGWIVAATRLDAASWQVLERGGIDAGGSPVLLLGRLAYFTYAIWGLGYLSLHFYRQRQHMRDRFNYIRLTIPWAAITLAIAAPALQGAGTLATFANPERLTSLWPPLWVMVSVIQVSVAALIVATFFPPAYRFVSWVDKQILIRRLLHIRRVVAQLRPDLRLGPVSLQNGPIVRDPDRWLATLVNELEMVKHLMGEVTYVVDAPAGGVMPDVARYALREEQALFLQGLNTKKTLAAPHVSGDTYALARWYVAVGSRL